VRVLKDARPPSGVTGAAFHNGRFYVAGQDAPEGFQVWSIDLETGARQLEIERQIVGESEGIDFFEGLGGTLHWLIQPYNDGGVPTYGVSNGTLLHFVPKGETPTTPVARPAKVRLSVSSRHLRAGRSVRLRFTASARIAGGDTPLRDVRISFEGVSGTTDAQGKAALRVTPRAVGVQRARGTRSDLRTGKINIRVFPPRR
jgi:hypothetical protein